MEQPKLLIYFDINKTIMFGDSVQNCSAFESFKSVCMSYSWGSLDSENKWKLEHNKFSLEKPREGLMNYKQYLEKYICRKKTKEEMPNDNERFNTNKKIKEHQLELTSLFFNDGEPGETLKKEFNEKLEKIKINKKVEEKIKNNPLFQKLFKDGYYSIFLSLFFTIIYLSEENRNFSIILRSFGEDANIVISEFNEFCEGNHPLFDGDIFKKYYFDGTHNSKDYRFKKENCGVIYRYSSNINDTYLITNEIERLKEKPKSIEDSIDKNKILKGKEIFEGLNKKLISGEINSYAIRDEYQIWSIEEEKKEYSKIMLMDPNDNNVHSIFFDDYLKESDIYSIIDCRDINTGLSMHYNDIINKYIFRTDSLRACSENDYFIKKIREAEDLRKGK